MTEVRNDIDTTKIEIDHTASALSRESYAPLPDGSRAIRFFVEENNAGQPILPKVEGRTINGGMKPLREAFEFMLEEIEDKPLDFKQSGYRHDSNLIVTSMPFPEGNNKLAMVDCTPSGQHRIIFNSAKQFDQALFKATAAHAFEISFGYPARKYDALLSDPYFMK